MPKYLLLSLTIICCYFAMAWFSFAIKSHWQQVTSGQELTGGKIKLYRVLGGIFLVIALVLCFLADNVSIAVLVWIMSTTAASIAVAFTLSYKPSWLRILALF